MTTSPKVIIAYGINLAKYSFSIHGDDHQGKVLTHKTITRSKLLETFAAWLGRIAKKATDICGQCVSWRTSCDRQ
ncbi:hypothetical protein IFO68_13000 [Photobacterium sp. CAU 1568]|uniref:Transposase n=1 Tax=Photobacterium arenosum TaxID=2774143 RepID=A0ABR9BQ38_9GAMM|nr:hypothetical protein [Photobacterium arenosum]MBD8513591.1 hypothetical protein [Photobacterium arenosum]